jgi:hypothetical protein
LASGSKREKLTLTALAVAGLAEAADFSGDAIGTDWAGGFGAGGDAADAGFGAGAVAASGHTAANGVRGFKGTRVDAGAGSTVPPTTAALSGCSCSSSRSSRTRKTVSGSFTTGLGLNGVVVLLTIFFDITFPFPACGALRINIIGNRSQADAAPNAVLRLRPFPTDHIMEPHTNLSMDLSSMRADKDRA